MKQAKHFLALIAVALFTTNAWAQMTFTYSTTATESTLSDGSTLVQLPANTNLNGGFITSVKVGGQTVSLDAITPNPKTTFITEGEIETFVYDGKAYSFRFLAGEYFTMVVFSDPHVDTEDIKNNVSAKTTAMANIGKDGGRMFKFNAVPWYTPKADLVVCLGDFDTDKPLVDGVPYYYFEEATAVFHEKKIPFIAITGNHDIHCDYFNDGSAGMTAGEPSTGPWKSNGGGQYSTEQSLKLIKQIYGNAESDGGFEVEQIKSSTGAENEPGHFTFMYKGVRFYCANTYWWQKPWDSPSTFSSAKYYSAKSTLDNLNEFVEDHNDDASIWLSHFPFRAAGWTTEDASERWWLDQNYQGENGADSKSILPSGDTEFYTSKAFTTEEGKAVANKKKMYLADIVVKSKNPIHFSGHTHINHVLDMTATNGAKFTDYTTQPITSTANSNGFDGNAFVVLCKAGVGVVDVIRTTF